MAYYDFNGYGGFPRYVSVAERRAKALKQARKLEKRGRKLEPVILTGQRIASSFWGKEWGKNLESYMDFSNRLPRGRTYLRSGAVVDLRIGAGQIDALVAGSSLYEVSVRIDKLARRRWWQRARSGAQHRQRKLSTGARWRAFSGSSWIAGRAARSNRSMTTSSRSSSCPRAAIARGEIAHRARSAQSGKNVAAVRRPETAAHLGRVSA